MMRVVDNSLAQQLHFLSFDGKSLRSQSTNDVSDNSHMRVPLITPHGNIIHRRYGFIP
jgi:hypothetical protein